MADKEQTTIRPLCVQEAQDNRHIYWVSVIKAVVRRLLLYISVFANLFFSHYECQNMLKILGTIFSVAMAVAAVVWIWEAERNPW